MKPVAKRKVKDVFMTGSARTIVITGASKGMGRALAVGFANDGYTVFGAARDARALDQTAELCSQGRFHGRALDVSNAREVAGWIDGIESSQGKVDVLICAAAVYPRAYFLDQSAEDWDEVLRINVGGVANACRAVLPGMLARRRGRIVVVGSMADMHPVAGSSAYSVSKGALHPLTRAIAAEINTAHYPDVRIAEYLPPATISGMSDMGVTPDYHYPVVKALAEGATHARSGGSFKPEGEMFLDPSPKSVLRNLKRRLFSKGR